jgi:hypothetical protein
MAVNGDGQRYYGTVKKIFQGSHGRPAHGFLECAETQLVFGRDVFIHDKIANFVHVGQALSFGVRINDAGMPQAVDVLTEDGSPLAESHSGGAYEFAVPTGQRLYDLLMPELSPALNSGMQQTVAAALLAAADLLGVANDLRMQVVATVPQEHVIASKGGWAPQQRHEPSWGPCKGGYKGCGKDAGWDMKGSGYGQGVGGGKAAPYQVPYSNAMGGYSGGGSPHPKGPFEGTVKSIKSAEEGSGHAHGFVDCHETQQIYGRDVFLHSEQANQLEVGMSVRFEVMLNNRGMPQAHNLVKFA